MLSIQFLTYGNFTTLSANRKSQPLIHRVNPTSIRKSATNRFSQRYGNVFTYSYYLETTFLIILYHIFQNVFCTQGWMHQNQFPTFDIFRATFIDNMLIFISPINSITRPHYHFHTAVFRRFQSIFAKIATWWHK